MFLFFLMIQLVMTAPRVSNVASYRGVTMRTLRCGILSGVGDGDCANCDGVGVALAVGCAEACGEAVVC